MDKKVKNRMLKIEDIQEVVNKYGKKYGAEKIFLLGSYARGDATEHSDVDLRIDKGDIVGGIALAGLLLDIERELGVQVDLVTTGSLSKDFLSAIRNEEKLLYANH